MLESASEQPSVIRVQVKKLKLILVKSPSHVVIKAYVISKWKGWNLNPCLLSFFLSCVPYIIFSWTLSFLLIYS